MEILVIENPITGKNDEWVVLGNEETGFTSMLKSVYDEQQAALADLPKATK